MFKKDQYREVRGGWTRLLSISCKECSTNIFKYQKDGPGPLKRSYLDRIISDIPKYDTKGYFHCKKCNLILGFYEPYAKENNRPALRWAVEAIKYKIIPAKL